MPQKPEEGSHSADPEGSKKTEEVNPVQDQTSKQKAERKIFRGDGHSRALNTINRLPTVTYFVTGRGYIHHQVSDVDRNLAYEAFQAAYADRTNQVLYEKFLVSAKNHIQRYDIAEQQQDAIYALVLAACQNAFE